MNIKTVSSTFSPDLEKVIREILKFTSDGVTIRDRLKSMYPDLWIVIHGKKFSYFVSRASKSAGIFHNLQNGIKFLIYTPPYTELTPYIPDPISPCSSTWTLLIVKKSSESPLIDDLYSFMQTLDYSDQSKAGELIKLKANHLEEKFWHVAIGSDFTCVLPDNDIEYLIYCKAKHQKESIDIVAFRKQGLQKKINWQGLFQGTILLVLTLIFFLGVLGMLKCTPGSETLLCRNYKTFLYIGLAFMFSKATKFLLSRLKRS